LYFSINSNSRFHSQIFEYVHKYKTDVNEISKFAIFFNVHIKISEIQA